MSPHVLVLGGTGLVGGRLLADTPGAFAHEADALRALATSSS